MTAAFTARPDQGAGTDLRTVAYGGIPILSRLYFALRDEHWGTVPLAVTRSEAHVRPDGFDVAVSAVSRDEALPIQVSLEYRARGRALHAEFVARAGSPFAYQRLGFCVLHPLTQRGAPARIGRRGRASEVSFPVDIAPQTVVDGVEQPVWGSPFDELEIALAGGAGVRFRFGGAEFELEDQRNWSDASFKTYSTPDETVAPLRADPHREYRQSIDIEITGPEITAAPAAAAPNALALGAVIGTLPNAGLWSGAAADEWRPAAGFVELNRGHASPPPDAPVGVGINAAVHAADSLSILESATTHGALAGQTRRLVPGHPIRLGPIDFTGRPGDWLDADGEVVDRPLVPSDDIRRTGALGAAFLLASLRSLAEAPPDAVRYFDAGIAGSRVAGLIDELRGWAGCDVLAVSEPEGIVALAVRVGDGVELRIASTLTEPRTVELPDGRSITVPLAGVESVRLALTPVSIDEAEGETA